MDWCLSWPLKEFQILCLEIFLLYLSWARIMVRCMSASPLCSACISVSYILHLHVFLCYILWYYSNLFFPTKLIMCSLWSNLLFRIFIESKFHLFYATKNSFLLQNWLGFWYNLFFICFFLFFYFLFIHYIQMSHVYKIWCFCFMKFLQFHPHDSHLQYFTLGFCDFKILWANVYWNHICESF